MLSVPAFADTVRLESVIVSMDAPFGEMADPYYRLIGEETAEDGNRYYIVEYNGNSVMIPYAYGQIIEEFETGTDSELRKAVIKTALSKLGKKYKRGKKGPDVFDCSGFDSYCLAAGGISIPSSSYAICFMGGQIDISQLRPGDIIARPGHVGIYLGNDIFIHAQNKKSGVVTDRLSVYNAHKGFTVYINPYGD